MSCNTPDPFDILKNKVDPTPGIFFNTEQDSIVNVDNYFKLQFNFETGASDIDKDFEISKLPSWLRVEWNHPNYGYLIGKPSNDDIGMNLIEMEFKLGSRKIVKSYNITVKALAPLFEDSVPTHAKSNKVFSYTPNIIYYGNDLSVNYKSLPSWLNQNNNSISGTPNENLVGKYFQFSMIIKTKYDSIQIDFNIKVHDTFKVTLINQDYKYLKITYFNDYFTVICKNDDDVFAYKFDYNFNQISTNEYTMNSPLGRILYTNVFENYFYIVDVVGIEGQNDNIRILKYDFLGSHYVENKIETTEYISVASSIDNKIVTFNINSTSFDSIEIQLLNEDGLLLESAETKRIDSAYSPRNFSPDLNGFGYLACNYSIYKIDSDLNTSHFYSSLYSVDNIQLLNSKSLLFLGNDNYESPSYSILNSNLEQVSFNNEEVSVEGKLVFKVALQDELSNIRIFGQSVQTNNSAKKNVFFSRFITENGDVIDDKIYSLNSFTSIFKGLIKNNKQLIFGKDDSGLVVYVMDEQGDYFEY